MASEAGQESAKKQAPTQLQQLAAEFGGNDVKSRAQSGITLTYIAIDATIRRLNDVLGSNWSTTAKTEFILLNPSVPGEYLAVCELELRARVDGNEKVAYGVGADKGKDADKIAKTALAEAIKKAAHQLGVALYLWDPAARARAEKLKALASGSEVALKREVVAIAKERTGKDKPTAAEIAAVFGVKAGDLADKATLQKILTDEGLL
jgi:hypothetical protein